MNGEQALDIGIAQEMLKQISHIGGNTYVNLLDGTSTYVPWGTLDWFGNILAFALIVAIFVGLGMFYRFMAKN